MIVQYCQHGVSMIIAKTITQNNKNWLVYHMISYDKYYFMIILELEIYKYEAGCDQQVF